MTGEVDRRDILSLFNCQRVCAREHGCPPAPAELGYAAVLPPFLFPVRIWGMHTYTPSVCFKLPGSGFDLHLDMQDLAPNAQGLTTTL